MPNPLREFIRSLPSALAEPCDSELERQYRALLKARPQLDDEAFYRQFYAGTGIPREIPLRLRKLYETITGDNLAGLRPDDNHARFYEGIDFGDTLYRVGKEFKNKIPNAEVVKSPHTYKGRTNPAGKIDGTFDSVVRYVHAATGGRPDKPENAAFDSA